MFFAANSTFWPSSRVSEDALRRALAKIDETAGVQWLQTHLDYCVGPLLDEPWVLDVDATIKPLYGHQEGAVVGYNPRKPGRPSHCYYTYMLSDLRLYCALRCVPAINTIPRTPPPGCGRSWRSSGESTGRACCAVMPNGATKE
jgi:hypothetical protein